MTLPPLDQQSIRDAIAREESRLLRIEEDLGEAQARLAALKIALARADSPEKLPSRVKPPSDCEKPLVRCGECSNQASYKGAMMAITLNPTTLLPDA